MHCLCLAVRVQDRVAANCNGSILGLHNPNFDEKMPITRMLPGSGPCDLRLLIPDAGLGKAGFHDVVIENLLGCKSRRIHSDFFSVFIHTH